MIARALGQRSSRQVPGRRGARGALGVVFLIHSSFALALWILLAVGLVAFLVPEPDPELDEPRGFALVALSGVVLGALLWHIAPRALTGDSPFHLARVRKLVDLGSLSPWRLDELVGGGLHPGYAFPLWHAFLAAVTKLAGVDPALVVQHESALLVPLAVVIAFEAGTALFGSPTLGAATAAAQVAIVAFAAGTAGHTRLLASPAPAAGTARPGRPRARLRVHARLDMARAALRGGRVARARARPPDVRGLPLHPLAGWLLVAALAEETAPGASPRGSPPSPFPRVPSGSRCCRWRATPCPTRRRRRSCCARSPITTTNSSCTARATTSHRRSSRGTAPSQWPR
jgi:hypothetical protein